MAGSRARQCLASESHRPGADTGPAVAGEFGHSAYQPFPPPQFLVIGQPQLPSLRTAEGTPPWSAPSLESLQAWGLASQPPVKEGGRGRGNEPLP